MSRLLPLALICFVAAATFATMRRALSVMTWNCFAAIALVSTSADPTPTRDGAGPQPVAGVIDRHAAGGHQLYLRQRTSDVLQIAGADRGRRKHFDEIRAHLPRIQNLGRRETAGHHGHTFFMRGFDDLAPEHRD